MLIPEATFLAGRLPVTQTTAMATVSWKSPQRSLSGKQIAITCYYMDLMRHLVVLYVSHNIGCNAGIGIICCLTDNKCWIRADDMSIWNPNPGCIWFRVTISETNDILSNCESHFVWQQSDFLHSICNRDIISIIKQNSTVIKWFKINTKTVINFKLWNYVLKCNICRTHTVYT